MPSFGKRPLTWLFFIAAACWAAVDAVRDGNSATTALFLTGFLDIAGAWAAVGKTHRLARGAALFAVPLAATLVIHLLDAPADETRSVLAFALISVGAAYASAGLAALAIRVLAPDKVSRGRRWQISLVEIMGWTVVTAIASFAVSKAQLPTAMAWAYLIASIISAVPAGIMIALFLVPKPRIDRAATVLSAVALGAYVLTWRFMGGGLLRGEDLWSAYLFGFVAVWILVVRLDEQALTAREVAERAAAAPPLKIHEGASHDE